MKTSYTNNDFWQHLSPTEIKSYQKITRHLELYSSEDTDFKALQDCIAENAQPLFNTLNGISKHDIVPVIWWLQLAKDEPALKLLASYGLQLLDPPVKCIHTYKELLIQALKDDQFTKAQYLLDNGLLMPKETTDYYDIMIDKNDDIDYMLGKQALGVEQDALHNLQLRMAKKIPSVQAQEKGISLLAHVCGTRISNREIEPSVLEKEDATHIELLKTFLSKGFDINTAQNIEDTDTGFIGYEYPIIRSTQRATPKLFRFIVDTHNTLGQLTFFQEQIKQYPLSITPEAYSYVSTKKEKLLFETEISQTNPTSEIDFSLAPENLEGLKRGKSRKI